MSATQSKKIRNGKTSAYKGRRRGGYCCGSELTRDVSVTLKCLKAFTPADVEACSAR